MRHTRRALAITSLLLYSAAAAISGAAFLGAGLPEDRSPADAPAPPAPRPAVDDGPVFPPPPAPPPPPPIIGCPGPRFDSLLRVERAAGGLAYVHWSSVNGERAGWLRAGDEIVVATGEAAVVDTMTIDDALGLEGTVSFRFRGAVEILPWRQ